MLSSSVTLAMWSAQQPHVEWTIILDSTWLSHLILRLENDPKRKCRAGQHWSWAGHFLFPGSSLVPGCGLLFYQLPLPSFFLHLSREWEHWQEESPSFAGCRSGPGFTTRPQAWELPQISHNIQKRPRLILLLKSSWLFCILTVWQ